MKVIRSLDKDLTNQYPDLKGCSLTIGNFESVHLGHLNLIKSLNKNSLDPLAKKVLISFEPSSNAFFLKTRMRIYGVKQKIELLSAHLDYLILLRFNQNLASQKAKDFLNQIKQSVNPSHISIGDDFCFGKNRLGNSQMIEKFCQTEKISFYQLHTIFDQKESAENRYSTSLVRENLKKYQFKAVKKILSRNYCLKGKVRKGMALARKIGFPTANIRLNFDPVFSGVFVAKVHLTEKAIFNLPAVCNLGKKPTFKGNHQNNFTLEVHLLEADINQKYGELLGQNLAVEFVSFIREEKKFSGIDELKNQIQKDIQTAQKQLGILN